MFQTSFHLKKTRERERERGRAMPAKGPEDPTWYFYPLCISKQSLAKEQERAFQTASAV